ncbi:MAG: LamG-like jellyroll fold domain-containing protein [Candidatus Nitrosoabyssus spongiisocia]|nr:MAG: LamG-like jellyroll fold domain-containing protein [Nitrosopumilaceae archaeon AB1(1)]
MEGSLFNNTDFTISVWANDDALNYFSRIVDFGNGHEQANIKFGISSVFSIMIYEIYNAGNSQSLSDRGVLSLSQWVYFTVVHESSGTATIYNNGASRTSRSLPTSDDVNRTSNYIGRTDNPAHSYFDGKLDEFRLSSTARSADWIATEYANQNSPSTFFTISAPEDRRVVITSAITNTQGDNIIITFNKNITYSVIPTTDFTLTGTSATIDSITSNSSSITLNLSGNLLANVTITISYTKTSGGINSTQNTDITLENFVNQPVINNILDTIPPVITLNGNNVVYVELGSSYSEQNATTDDNSPVTIGGDTVDTNTVGNYTITYNSTDSSGNNATQVNRTVIVRDTTAPVITLNGNATVYVELDSFLL